jgi:transcriptional regulator with XRE-family HTH domain
MARQRVSQAALAEALGVSQGAVSRRLRGDIPFDVEMLGRIAAHLHVPVTQFVRADALLEERSA